MNAELSRMLKRITPEEKAALSGQKNVQWSIYTDQPQQYVVEHEKLLESNGLITARKHTRFVYFPPHKHNYVEFFLRPVRIRDPQGGRNGTGRGERRTAVYEPAHRA